MRILISGSSGLIGSALAMTLAGEQHDVLRLVRTASTGAVSIQWDPDAAYIDRSALTGLDAVVHLAGQNIAGGRWTRRYRDRIRSSRVEGTRLLCRTLAELEPAPRVIISASAVGYYGHREDELLDEDSNAGTGFLSDVCREWEAATHLASDRGIRVVHLRLGMVLSTRGGALKEMLLPFRMGVGGRMGPGTQYLSWIGLDDVVNAIQFIIANDSLSGPVNCVSPNPVTNGQFVQALAAVLHRPALIPVPAFALRLLLGQMADELLLASTRVIPKRLMETAFSFRHSGIEDALKHALRTAPQA